MSDNGTEEPSNDLLADFEGVAESQRADRRSSQALESPQLTHGEQSPLHAEAPRVDLYGEDSISYGRFLQNMLDNQTELHERIMSAIQHLPVSSSVPVPKSTNKKPTALQEVNSRLNSTNNDLRVVAAACQQISANMADTIGYLKRQNENLPQLLRSSLPSGQSAPRVKVVRTVDDATYRKAKHFVHWTFAHLIGFQLKAPPDLIEYEVAPGVEIGTRMPGPVLGSDAVTVKVVVDKDSEGKTLEETRWRPDFLDKKAKASSEFLTRVLDDAETAFPDFPKAELNSIIAQYWSTCRERYEEQEGVNGKDRRKAIKRVFKGIETRQEYIWKGRHQKYANGPLAECRRSDWYSTVFKEDFLKGCRAGLVPLYLTDDNLPSGRRYEQTPEFDERRYWIRRSLGFSAGREKVWEVVELWWASAELRLACQLQDAFLRSGSGMTGQKHFWWGPRSKWCDKNGKRSLPSILKTPLRASDDPKKLSGLFLCEWMVDKTYVRKVKGEEGKDWCKGLHPDPAYTAPTKSSPLEEVLSRSQWEDVRGQQATWNDCLLLDDEAVPARSVMMEQLARWEAEDRRPGMVSSLGM